MRLKEFIHEAFRLGSGKMRLKEFIHEAFRLGSGMHDALNAHFASQ